MFQQPVVQCGKPLPCAARAALECREDKTEEGSQVSPANFVLERDTMGRPTLWKIGGLMRQISYLPSGKIHYIGESGQLPPVATSSGKPAYLLSFETHDAGRTYIGRFQSQDDIEPIVMTRVDVRSDGTIVTADDAGLEMSWNPNTGEAAATFRHRNNQQETWIDHLDGTVTAELKFPNKVVAVLHGRQETEFCPGKITIEASGTTIQMVAAYIEGKSLVLVSDSNGKTTAVLERSLIELARLLMQAASVTVGWQQMEALPSISVQDRATRSFVRLDMEI